MHALTTKRDRIAFVLAGGGTLGAVQVGMLRALLEAGIRPDMVVGTSIGALNGAYLAGHPDLLGLDHLAQLWTSVQRHDVFPLNVRNLARAVIGQRNALFDAGGLRALILRADVGFSNLEDAPIPMHVVAADLATGDSVILSKGDVVEALLASAAIPGVFPPVEIDHHLLIDGGVVANIAVLEAESLGASTLYVLPTASEDLTVVPSSPQEMLQHAMLLATRPVLGGVVDSVAARTDLRFLPAVFGAGHLSMFDFGGTREFIELAYRRTVAWLESDRANAEVMV